MKKIYKYLCVYAAFILQTLFIEKIHIISATPNLLLSAVMLCAIYSTPIEAGIIGAVVGIFSDALLKPYFGGDTLFYMYAAIGASVLVQKRSTNSPLIMGWYGFVTMAFVYVLTAAVRICARLEWSAAKTGADIFVSGILGALLFFSVTLVLQLKNRNTKKDSDEVQSI